MARQIVVDIIGNSKKYTKATDDAIKSSKGLSGVLDKLDAKMVGLGRRGTVTGALLGGAGVGVGLGAFSLIERGVAGVVNALGDAVTAAIEDEKATAKLTQTIKANVAAWNGNLDVVNQAIEAGARLAFTDDDIRDGLNQLIPRTKDLTKAIELNRLAMDLARAKGMGLEEAATLVGKAFSGQASALRRAGIYIKNTKDSTAALAQLQAAVSGQADTYANSTEGAMKRLDIQMSEALESLGYALKPLVASLASLASSIIPQVVNAIGLFGEAMHNAQRIADGSFAATEDLNASILAQAASYGVSADAVIAFTETVKKNQEAIRIQAGLVAEFQGVISETDPAIQHLAKMMGVTNDEAKNLAIVKMTDRVEALAKSYGLTVEEFRQAVPLLIQNSDTMADLYQRLDDLEAGLVEVETAAADVGPTMAEQARQMIGVYQAIEITGKALRGLVPDFSAVGQAAAKTKPVIYTPAVAIKRTTHAMTQTMADFLSPFKAAWKEAAEWAKDPFKPHKFENWLHARVKEATRKAKKAAEEGKPEVARRWRAIANAMKSPVITAIGEIKTSIAEVIRAMEIVRLVAKRTGTTRMGSNAKVGGRAAGGPVTAGRPYVVGEKRPELFVPDRSGTILPSVPGMGGGGNTYNVVVNVAPGGDLVEAGRQMVRAITQYERRSGRVWRSA